MSTTSWVPWGVQNALQNDRLPQVRGVGMVWAQILGSFFQGILFSYKCSRGGRWSFSGFQLRLNSRATDKPENILRAKHQLAELPVPGNAVRPQEEWDGAGLLLRPSLLFLFLSVFHKVPTAGPQKGPGKSTEREGVSTYWDHKFDLTSGRPLRLRHICFTIRMELGHLENSVPHLMNSFLQK